MRVDNQDIREFLSSGSIYSSLSREKRERYLILYENATKVTSHLTGLPSGGGSDRNDTLASLADASGSSDRWWGFLQARRELIRSFIEEAPISEFHREILIDRYIYNLGWEPMIYTTQKYGKQSTASLRSEHEKTLTECAAWVNFTGKFREEILNK